MLTWVASAAWSTLSAVARASASRGWAGGARLPARVISVGNIQVGGAGKTPLVAAIANEAHERGLKACILCRGYGGAWEKEGGVLLPRAASAGRAASAAECGDEAALLHDLAPGAVIGVGADRVRQMERVREAVGEVDLVILDDGFQHWRIRKDVEVVALTSARRSGTLFRDWESALRHADLLVWTKGDRRPVVPEGKPLVRVRYRLAPPGAEAGDFWLVSGVADSRSVEVLAREAGYRIARHVSFPDHARYAESIVSDLLESARRAGTRIALTGKDWVKWRELGLPPGTASRVTVLEPELQWIEGKESWDRVLWER